jgi:hypothetical protein
MSKNGATPDKAWRAGSQFCGQFPAMNVIALTVFVGLVLVTLFALLFVAQALSHPPGGGQEALLPLSDEDSHPEARK